MKIIPIDEQAHAVEVFNDGLSMSVIALAGTGKSSTLRLMAESTRRRGQYLAFNRAVVDDAKASFPRNVACSTAHSLAFRAVGKRFEHRLRQPRMRSYEIARKLGLTKAITISLGGGEHKVLQPGFLASSVIAGLKMFAFSADTEPGPQHIAWIDGIDLAFQNGQRKTENNDYVAHILAAHMRKAWDDISNTAGTLPFTHDFYVKQWEMADPKIPGDYILIDESQDLSPVMMSVIEQQKDAQTVWVGDTNQQLYEWRGSVDAMSLATVDATTRLRQSFRFGPEIAEVANMILDRIPHNDPELRVLGLPTVDSTVHIVTYPPTPTDAVLCRTNAAAITRLLWLQREGRKPHLVGGGGDVAAFARAAEQLKAGNHTDYHELACFDSWLAVQDYVDSDPQGSELRLLVNLVDEFTPPVIINAIEDMVPEASSDIIVSTAHRSKGREWSTVELGDDFGDPEGVGELDTGELRLLYVAATRAKHHLNATRCAPVSDMLRVR